MARTDDQINIRVPAEAHAVLMAAAYVRGLKSPSDLVKSHVDELVVALAKEPAVELALKAQEMHAAEAGGRLKHLPSQRATG
jgi:uncharacterized protein (DUF1778 family)